MEGTSSVLITGARGFIGNALLLQLRQAGIPALGATRAKTSDSSFVSCPPLGAHADWRAVLDGRQFVVHTAARVHVMRDVSPDPIAAFREANVEGTLTLAKQAAAAGVKRFVFISSVKVHGETCVADKPFTTRDRSRPTDPYSVSKEQAETLLLQLANETGMEVVVLRPPLVYGPGVGGNFLRLMQCVDQGWPLPLASVVNRRSLLYVYNLVDAIKVCLAHPAAANQTFLLSDGEDVSTPELIRRLARLMDRNPRLVPFPPKLMRKIVGLLGQGEAAERLIGSLTVDNAPIVKGLAWKPPFSLDHGLADTVAWYRSRGRP